MRAPVLVFPRTRTPSQGRGYLDAGAAGTAEAFGSAIAKGAGSIGAGLTDLAAVYQDRTDRVNRFKYLTDWTQHETESLLEREELVRTAPDYTTDLPVLTNEAYDKRDAEFRKTITDPRLQAEHDSRSAGLKQRLTLQSYGDQVKKQDMFQTTKLNDSFYTRQNRVKADRTLLLKEKQELAAELDATTLPMEEKLRLGQLYGQGLEGASFGNEAIDIRGRSAQQGPPPNYSESAQSITGRLVGRQVDPGDPPLTPLHAAVVAGNMQQESGFRTWAHNAKEGAHGLIQWRLDRWEDLQAAAAVAGKDWRDTDFQIGFFLREFKEKYPEAWQKFITATTMEDMNAAMKQYIKYGDDSQGTRLANAKAILNGADPQADVTARDDSYAADMAALNSNPLYDRVPMPDRMAMIASADAQIDEAERERAAAATASIQDQLNNLAVGLHDGTMDLTDIQEARKAGWLEDIDDIEKMEKIWADQNEGVQGQARIQSLLDGRGMPDFNPDDTDDKKALNAYIGKDGLTQLSNMNEGYVNTTLLPTISKLHDVPTDVAGTLEGMSRSADPKKALFAIGVLAQMEEVDQRAYRSRVDETVAKDVDFWRARKDYMTPQDLLLALRGGRDPANRKQVDQLREEARDFLSKNEGGVTNLSSRIGEFLGRDQFNPPGWTNAPNLGYAARSMDAEYQAAFVDAYTRYVDPDEAAKAAELVLARHWGVTTLGGGDPVVMKFPPHKVGYPTKDGSYDWIDAQVRTMTPVGPELQYQLLSDDRTKQDFIRWQRGLGPTPSYMIAVNDPENGGWGVLSLENGAPRRWNFAVTDVVDPAFTAAQEKASPMTAAERYGGQM